MRMSKRFVYRVRFKVNGEPKTFRTTASSPKQAADKLRSKGRILSVTKVRETH